MSASDQNSDHRNVASGLVPGAAARTGSAPRLRTWRGNKSVRLRGFDYSEHVPYHVVVRAHGQTTPFFDVRLATLCCRELADLCDQLNAYLGCYCLMPDHLHVLLSPDQSGLQLGSILGRYKSLTTRESWTLGHRGRLWQPRFYDHIVRKSEDIMAVARYIYENPDRKGLETEYPYRWVDAAVA